MLIEQLFKSGMMTMGPSRGDPARQVGVFAPGAVQALAAAKTAELERFRWIEGEWSVENRVPETGCNPAYSEVGTHRYVITGDGWVALTGSDARQHKVITFDPFSKQWIYVLTRGSYGMLRSKQGWVDGKISFSGLMTMIGIECEWRMTWERLSDSEFRFVNEEGLADGSFAYIDEWRFLRKA